MARRGRSKHERGGNYFSVLDEDETSVLVPGLLGPSLLSGGAPSTVLTGVIPPIAAMVATHGGADGAPAGSSALMSSITSDLLSELSTIAAPPAEATWDFSTLVSTAVDAEKRMLEDATSLRAQFEKSLAAAHEADATYLKEKLAIQRSGVSHKARVRHGKDVEKGENFSSRMSSKVARTDARKRARNRVKHAPM